MESKKQIVIVTGASSGMGQEFVRQINELYPKFDEIWVIARRANRLQELADEIGDKIVVLPLDLTKRSSMDELREKLEESNVEVRLLVNAAGFGYLSDFDQTESSKWEDMIDLNCTALTTVTHIVLQHMPRKSRIINLASVASFAPQPGLNVYAASKSYVLSFSRSLRVELRKREISVTAVCPGPVDTEFFAVADPNDQTAFYKKMVLANPSLVVCKALYDASFGKEISIYGALMNTLVALEKITPHFLITELAGWFTKIK